MISCAVEVWLLSNDTGCVYACCASNVAARNIAIALAKTDQQFRLLVSKDFFFEWHEDLYGKLGPRLIVGNALKPDLKRDELDTLMGGVRVVVSSAQHKSLDFTQN